MTSARDLGPRFRLASGLVLLVFAATHLTNHALAIHSLEAANQGRALFQAIWRSPPGTLLLYGALLLHAGLALHKLYRRRNFRLPAWEVTQVALGFLIPFLLVLHVVGTRGAHERFGVEDDYLYALVSLWPENAMRQSVLVLIVWLHGCLGVHFWLRLRSSWYPAVRPWLFACAILLPTLALTGFVVGGRAVEARATADPAWLAAAAERGNWPGEAGRAWIYGFERAVVGGFGALLIATLGGRAIRNLRNRARGRLRLRYPDGVTVSITPGMSVLEASRAAGIPHASVCGGRGRCSTCRVRVSAGAKHLPSPSAGEARVLARIGASDDVRLACQLRPTHDLGVMPLLPAGAGPRDVLKQVDPGQGIEREIAVLFADLRAFTRFAEGRLPYDVVFLLNQYFGAMGEAIEAEGGRVDKFLGDGIMAWFGMDAEPERACRQSLAGARAMALALDRLNHHLQDELPEPLRMGIGLHAGPVIVGEMGYRGTTSLTAVGDPVNVASRLETLSKEFGAQLVVSAGLAERAGIDLAGFALRETEIRGRQRPLRIRVVPNARDLPVEVGESEPAGRSLLTVLGRPSLSFDRLTGRR